MPRKAKYKLRSDGRRETTKTYGSVKKHFYGKTDAEIDAKIAAYEAELAAAPEKEIRKFTDVADEYMEAQRKHR